MFNTDAFNNKVTAAAKELTLAMQQQAAKYNIQHRGNSPSNSNSVKKIKENTRQKQGLISQIGYKFPRHLVFVHKGAGKGHGGVKGSRWVDKFGNTQKTNPASLGKQGTGNRKEKPFFNDALNGPLGIEKIAVIAATEIGAAITGQLFIK